MALLLLVGALCWWHRRRLHSSHAGETAISAEPKEKKTIGEAEEGGVAAHPSNNKASTSAELPHGRMSSSTPSKRQSAAAASSPVEEICIAAAVDESEDATDAEVMAERTPPPLASPLLSANHQQFYEQSPAETVDVSSSHELYTTTTKEEIISVEKGSVVVADRVLDDVIESLAETSISTSPPRKQQPQPAAHHQPVFTIPTSVDPPPITFAAALPQQPMMDEANDKDSAEARRVEVRTCICARKWSHATKRDATREHHVTI